MRIRPLFVVTAAATLAATPASADSIHVEYKDLDLATDVGQKTLQSRLDSAARQVCGIDEITTGTRMPSNAARKCYQEARRNIGDQFAGVMSKATKGG